MSTTPDGLQFPLQSPQQKPSSSKAGRAIIAAALANVDSRSSQQAQSEKTGANTTQYILSSWSSKD